MEMGNPTDPINVSNQVFEAEVYTTILNHRFLKPMGGDGNTFPPFRGSQEMNSIADFDEQQLATLRDRQAELQKKKAALQAELDKLIEAGLSWPERAVTVMIPGTLPARTATRLIPHSRSRND